MTSQNQDDARVAANAAAASEFHNLHELVAKARANLNQNDWDYIVGGTETETTLRRNRMALDFDRLPAARAARCEQGRCVVRGAGPEAAAAGRAVSGRFARELSCRRRRTGGQGGGRIRRRAYAEFGVRSGPRSGRASRAECAAHVSALCPRRRGLGRRSRRARDQERLFGIRASPSTPPITAGASAIWRSAIPPAGAAAPPGAISRWRSTGAPSSA